jgi:hypothetical protein
MSAKACLNLQSELALIQGSECVAFSARLARRRPRLTRRRASRAAAGLLCQAGLRLGRSVHRSVAQHPASAGTPPALRPPLSCRRPPSTRTAMPRAQRRAGRAGRAAALALGCLAARFGSAAAQDGLPEPDKPFVTTLSGDGACARARARSRGRRCAAWRSAQLPAERCAAPKALRRALQADPPSASPTWVPRGPAR